MLQENPALAQHIIGLRAAILPVIQAPTPTSMFDALAAHLTRKGSDPPYLDRKAYAGMLKLLLSSLDGNVLRAFGASKLAAVFLAPPVLDVMYKRILWSVQHMRALVETTLLPLVDAQGEAPLKLLDVMPLDRKPFDLPPRFTQRRAQFSLFGDGDELSACIGDDTPSVEGGFDVIVCASGLYAPHLALSVCALAPKLAIGGQLWLLYLARFEERACLRLAKLQLELLRNTDVFGLEEQAHDRIALLKLTRLATRACPATPLPCNWLRRRETVMLAGEGGKPEAVDVLMTGAPGSQPRPPGKVDGFYAVCLKLDGALASGSCEVLEKLLAELWEARVEAGWTTEKLIDFRLKIMIYIGRAIRMQQRTEKQHLLGKGSKSLKLALESSQLVTGFAVPIAMGSDVSRTLVEQLSGSGPLLVEATEVVAAFAEAVGMGVNGDGAEIEANRTHAPTSDGAERTTSGDRRAGGRARQSLHICFCVRFV